MIESGNPATRLVDTILAVLAALDLEFQAAARSRQRNIEDLLPDSDALRKRVANKVGAAGYDIASGMNEAIAALETALPADFPQELHEAVKAGIQSRMRVLEAGLRHWTPRGLGHLIPSLNA